MRKKLEVKWDIPFANAFATLNISLQVLFSFPRGDNCVRYGNYVHKAQSFYLFNILSVEKVVYLEQTNLKLQISVFG